MDSTSAQSHVHLDYNALYDTSTVSSIRKPFCDVEIVHRDFNITVPCETDESLDLYQFHDFVCYEDVLHPRFQHDLGFSQFLTANPDRSNV